MKKMGSWELERMEYRKQEIHHVGAVPQGLPVLSPNARAEPAEASVQGVTACECEPFANSR